MRRWVWQEKVFKELGSFNPTFGTTGVRPMYCTHPWLCGVEARLHRKAIRAHLHGMATSRQPCIHPLSRTSLRSRWIPTPRPERRADYETLQKHFPQPRFTFQVLLECAILMQSPVPAVSIQEYEVTLLQYNPSRHNVTPVCELSLPAVQIR